MLHTIFHTYTWHAAHPAPPYLLMAGLHWCCLHVLGKSVQRGDAVKQDSEPASACSFFLGGVQEAAHVSSCQSPCHAHQGHDLLLQENFVA